MIKTTAEHPVFKRLAQQLSIEAGQFMAHLHRLVGEFQFAPHNIESAVHAFKVRRARELGLNGRYVAH